MDGFRPDYLDRNITPNINYLGKMIPSFIAGLTGSQAGRQAYKETRWIDRETHGQRDTRTDRQTDRRRAGQTDGETQGVRLEVKRTGR